MRKILLIHNTAMTYRRPFFNMLSQIYDIKFIFYDMKISNKRYGLDLIDKIPGLENVDYKIFKKSSLVSLSLLRDIISQDYDILICSLESLESIILFIIAKVRTKPILFWSEEWNFNKSLRRKLSSPFLNYLVAHSDGIMVPGTRHKAYFISLGASPERVFILRNVSDISVKHEDYLIKEELISKHNLNNKKVILYCGRLIERKGINYLINGFYHLRNEMVNIVLIVIGRGNNELTLKSLVKDLNMENDVLFLGYISEDLLPAYYLLSDICVVPSISERMADPCPLVVNEAMYFGKPVVATDAVGSAFDMIQDGKNGFIVPERDSEAIYLAMKTIVTNPDIEKEMGELSQRIVVENYNYSKMVNDFNKIMDFLM